jgi:hypothetical protein
MSGKLIRLAALGVKPDVGSFFASAHLTYRRETDRRLGSVTGVGRTRRTILHHN